MTATDILSATARLNQSDVILSKIEPGRDYSLREIAALTGYETNIVSSRVSALKDAKKLSDSCPKRNCTVTGVLIRPVKLHVVPVMLKAAA